MQNQPSLQVEPDQEKTTEMRLGPIALTRSLIATCKAQGVVSITYHYSMRFSRFSSTLPHLYFENDRLFSRHSLPEEHAEVLNRCHEFIIDRGKPLVVSNFLPAFAAEEPELTDQIMGEANKLGVVDQYMIPVFGPYDVNGVISFGFPETIERSWKQKLQFLEGAAAAHHNRMIRHFQGKQKDVELSERENEVLSWIAKGKSSRDIATILGIQRSSVDTYTRRIFEKMGVNDRVSAAVNAVVGGLVKPL